MLSLILAFFSIILLLALHEFGHFIVAKKFGVRVEEFGFGYPPRIFGKKIGDTLYSINLLPFGAFIRVPEKKEEISDPENFREKPIYQRALILLGGVVSFWVMGAILLSIVFALGVPEEVSDEVFMPEARVEIVAVERASPAETSGLQVSDKVLKVISESKTEEISKVKELQDFIQESKGKEVFFVVERGSENLTISLTPRENPPEGQGSAGIGLARTVQRKYPAWKASLKGVESSILITRNIVLSWGDIISGVFGGKGVPQGVEFVGAVGLSSLLSQAAKVGISYFLQFIAVIALNLAFFNILPIPVLDGGKLMFLGIEKIRGKAINPKIEEKITTVFFLLFLVLMVFVTVKDIIKFF